MTLKEIRKKNQISQKQAASIVNMPIRTYIRYENDESYGNEIKRNAVCDSITEHFRIDEVKGIVSREEIIKVANEVFSKYDVSFAYLFGSYAKNKQTEKSDIDIAIGTKITGLDFFGLVEDLREKLKKKTDLIRVSDIDPKSEIINEIFKDGIKIYG